MKKPKTKKFKHQKNLIQQAVLDNVRPTEISDKRMRSGKRNYYTIEHYIWLFNLTDNMLRKGYRYD